MAESEREDLAKVIEEHLRGLVTIRRNTADVLADAILAAGYSRAAWRPIESAPRDGTWFWACREGSKIPFVTAYDEDHEYDQSAEWFTFNQHYENTCRKPGEPRRKWEPTHWMPIEPLPPPPTGERR